MKNAIQNKIDEVSNNFPSIYSKEDVIKILNDLVNENQEKSSSKVIDDILEQVKEEFNNKLNHIDVDDVIDKSTATFDIDYGNTLTLDDVEFNTDAIKDILDEIISDIKSELESNEEE